MLYLSDMNIVKLSLVGCLFIIMACQSTDVSVEIKPPAADTTLPPPPPPLPPMVTTRVDVLPLRHLPEGFRLDSLQYTDTTVDHTVLVYFPVAVADNNFNKRVQQFIRRHQKDHFPDRPHEEFQNSEFELWITGFDVENKHLKFTMQSYYSGAAHFNQDSAVFVYH